MSAAVRRKVGRGGVQDALEAGRLAADRALRAEAEEIEAAEAALDLLRDPEHPDVTATARLLAHHTEALTQATARLGLDAEVEAYLDAACAAAPETTEAQRQAENERDAERTTKMPYPFSAARWRAHVLSFTTTD
ncbi:hypothetical protein [Streptomyces sp. NPDC059708]|uniref:hypothetical protein n=1 Tax=Streptomyces sp. NPDC059708 TaxID=3346916 RepID=UPI00367C2D23